MKKLILAFAMFAFFAPVLEAQETVDTILFGQYDDATYVQTVITYDLEGREISRALRYYDTTEVKNMLLNQVVGNDIILDNQEKQVSARQKNFEALKKEYKDFTGDTYKKGLFDLKSAEFAGDWVLTVGDSTYSVEATTSLKRIRGKDNNDVQMLISYERNNVVGISEANGKTPFFIGEATLAERVNKKGAFFVGKTSEGLKISLRKPK